MKYTVDVFIDKPRDIVVKELRSKEAAFKWMEGLKEFELIKGKEDEENSVYKMVFENKGKTSEMIETITKMDPPEIITTVYEMGSVWNECVNLFETTRKGTKYTMEVTFKFGFPWILFAWMFRPVFKKQTLSGMESFKAYLESL
jgi:hypothetical protein